MNRQRRFSSGIMRPTLSLNPHYFISAQGTAMDPLNDLATITLPEKKDRLPTTQAHQHYWQVATSNNTRRAYQSDVRHFIRTGGLLPATTESLMHYLNSQASQINPRTLKRRLVALKQWHLTQIFPDPTSHPLIKKTVRGIARIFGKPANKAAVFCVEQLIMLNAHLKTKGALMDYRDNALLQIGFFGAFRRSELVAIRWSHITFVKEGIEILIPRSKTDREGKGVVCAIPYGSPSLCPVTALKEWRARSNITEDTDRFVFSAVRQEKCPVEKGLSPEMVSLVIKKRVTECGFPNAEKYSGHSLRRSFATAACQKGASLSAIMRQGRWVHEATVNGYIEEGKKFEANAASAILEKT
jgi:site-specific recombinase XerD